MKTNWQVKQIYVKAEDVGIYEEAAQLGESLSSVIAEALREYLEKRRED